MRKIWAFLLTLVFLICLVPSHASASTVIDNVAVILDYPEAGKIPPGTATCMGKGYEIYAVDWFDRNHNRFLEANETIKAGHQYEAVVWVMASDGYNFKAQNDNTPSISATVNGEAVEPTKAFEYKAWAMVNLTYSFLPVPSKGWITSIDVSIPAPVVGQKPFYDKITTEQYNLSNVYFNDQTNPDMKNGILWQRASDGVAISPTSNAVYSEFTEYELRCLIFPNEGYSMTDNTVVRINGVQAEAEMDYASFLSVKFKFPATGNVQNHIHTPGEWRCTAADHYRVCVDCYEIVENGPHTGGNATCTKKGKCTVCGYEYLEIIEAHTPDTTKWTACGALYHAHLCKDCGAHCNPQEHIPGPAATESNPQICTVCNYIIQPAKNHTHKLTKVEKVNATCTDNGCNEYYTCSGCSERFADADGKNKIADIDSLIIAATGHVQTGEWSTTAEEHWLVCQNCNQIMTETKLTHEMIDGKCGVCGYKNNGEAVTEKLPIETKGEEQTPETSDKNDENEKKDEINKEGKELGWLPPVLIGVVFFVGAIIATVLILKKR